MDYCSLTDVLSLIGDDTNPTPRPNPAPFSDTVIAACITQASRAIDRDVTNSEAGDDYFKQETVTAQILRGQVDKDGYIIAWLRKPTVSSISAFSYRYGPLESWQDVPVSAIIVEGYEATAFVRAASHSRVFVRVTFSGGLATSSSGLPGDIVRAASVLAARYYKEGKTGLTDVIGMSELGTAQYVKAVPLEVKVLLAPYERPVPW